MWYVTGLLYIENLSTFHTLLQPKFEFQELNHILDIPKFHISRKIPYLKNQLCIMLLSNQGLFSRKFYFKGITGGMNIVWIL